MRPSLLLIFTLGLLWPGMTHQVAISIAEGSGIGESSGIQPEYGDIESNEANTSKLMRKSCELKNAYLAGVLPNNRMPKFVSASVAFESCQQERGCLGMTYDPKIGKWTLRSSSEPMESTIGEVSMLKDCVNTHGLPRYTIEAKQHCYDSMREEFTDFQDAAKSCDMDSNCAGIWDDKCDGNHFYTCASGRDWNEISRSSSCIHRKNPEKSTTKDDHTAFDEDVMLGDQPIEDRMNKIESTKVKNSCAPDCSTCKPLIDLASERWCLRQCNNEPSDCPSNLCDCS